MLKKQITKIPPAVSLPEEFCDKSQSYFGSIILPYFFSEMSNTDIAFMGVSSAEADASLPDVFDVGPPVSGL